MINSIDGVNQKTRWVIDDVFYIETYVDDPENICLGFEWTDDKITVQKQTLEKIYRVISENILSSQVDETKHEIDEKYFANLFYKWLAEKRAENMTIFNSTFSFFSLLMDDMYTISIKNYPSSYDMLRQCFELVTYMGILGPHDDPFDWLKKDISKINPVWKAIFKNWNELYMWHLLGNIRKIDEFFINTLRDYPINE